MFVFLVAPHHATHPPALPAGVGGREEGGGGRGGWGGGGGGGVQREAEVQL